MITLVCLLSLTPVMSPSPDSSESFLWAIHPRVPSPSASGDENSLASFGCSAAPAQADLWGWAVTPRLCWSLISSRASVGDRAAKEIQANLQQMKVLKSSPKIAHNNSKLNSEQPKLSPLQGLLQRILPIPSPTWARLDWWDRNSQPHPRCKAAKSTKDGTKDEGAVNNLRDSWDPAWVMPSPALVDLGQSCGSAVQRIPAGSPLLPGRISLFNSIFPGISWQSSPLQNHRTLPAQLDCNNSVRWIKGVFSNQQI